jgi:hypothetical protein
LDHKALKGREVLKGHREHKELQVQLYLQVIQVQQEPKVLRVHKAHKERTDLLVVEVLQDLVVPLALITLPLGLQVPKVLRVDHKGPKGPKGFRTSVYKDSKVLLVLLVQVLQVLQGFKVPKELQG